MAKKQKPSKEKGKEHTAAVAPTPQSTMAKNQKLLKEKGKEKQKPSTEKDKSKKRMSPQKILLELADHNAFFDMLVDMIPSKLYIPGQSGDDYNPKSKYHTTQPEEGKEARRAAAKLGKRRKLDPDLVESTVEKKKKLAEEEEGSAPSPSKKAKLPTKITPQKRQQDESSNVPTNASGDSPQTTNNQSRIEALREKLHAKIAAKQASRPNSGGAAGGDNGEDASSNPQQVSKRAARRAEKRRRQEEAKRKKKAGTTATNKSTTNQQSVNYTLQQQQEANEASRDLERMDFGRLSGLKSPSASGNYLEGNKALANLNKSKNMAKLLADAEAKRQKIQELKKSNLKEDQAKAAAIQWSDALKEADGHRVKDDPRKLKKALQRKVAKKQKSQKAWKARLDQTASAAQERQSIRQHNLTARKRGGSVGANLSKKKIVDTSTASSATPQKEDKGRRLSRAGFEGRKQDFLNSGGKQ